MITEDQLMKITNIMKEKVWRNYNIMFEGSDEIGDLVDIATSLHNLLYEAITGKKYNYAFHWANKIGECCEDNFFDEEEAKND